jgi:hypothetical protein
MVDPIDQMINFRRKGVDNLSKFDRGADGLDYRIIADCIKFKQIKFLEFILRKKNNLFEKFGKLKKN